MYVHESFDTVCHELVLLHVCWFRRGQASGERRERVRETDSEREREGEKETERDRGNERERVR